MICPLCRCDNTRHVASDKQRGYLQCSCCELVFVPVSQHINREREKERYAHHNNTADNVDYWRYLRSVAADLRRIPLSRPRVLDFGSGPACVLTAILSEQGIVCNAYDPLYGIGEEVLSKTYDIVVACEVVEHLRDLRGDLALINNLLRPQGYVLVRTQLYQTTNQFPGWWYCADPTHINFLNERSVHYMAQMLERRVCYCDERGVSIIGPDYCSTAPRIV